MFRPALRSAFLLLISLLAVPLAAQAQVDVTEASLSVTIARSSVVSDSFAVEFRVTGTDLNTGSITPPGLPLIPLTQDGSDLVVERTYNNVAALNAAWPDGNYDLRVNAGVQATLAYTQPLVPDPAISKPGAGSVVPPGPVEVLFTKCTVCTSPVLDSVVAVLENEANVVLDESDDLTSASEEWTPEDGLGDPLQLAEQSSFVTSVTSSALRQANTPVLGEASSADDILLFSNRFVQSDEIDFTTGFDTPSGAFCLAANHPAPPVGCTTLTDPLLEILDTSSPPLFMTQVDGHDVAYTVVVSDKGTITGSATADLDDNASQETGPAPIKGKLKGKSGEVKSKLSFSLENTAPPAKVKVKISDEYSIPGNSFEGTQTASGSINGAKLKEEILSGGPLPFLPLGWLLELDIDASGVVSNALLTLENARSFPLSGKNKFKFSSGESLKLESADKGIRIGLKKIVLDDSTAPMGVTGGDVSPSILGQKAKTTIP